MSHSLLEGFDVYVKTELGLSQETILAYTRDVEEFIAFIGNEKLTSQIVELFIENLRHQDLQTTTIRRKCMSIRCLCHHLISLKKIDDNMLAMIDPVRIERKKPNALNDKDVDLLLDTIRNRVPKSRAINIHRDVSIVLTLHHSGLRVAELCSLDLPSVNFKNRLIRVMGKGKVERIVPMTYVCAEAMQTYIKKERKSIDSILFVKTNGQRITRRAVSDMITSLANKTGIKHTTSHTLRISCATSLMNRGVDINMIQLLLGHQNLETTQSYLAISNKKLMNVHRQYHPFGDNNVF